MTIDQIAQELKQLPDAALQADANNPSVPGYLLAAETNRRLSARNAANTSQSQGKPTILQQLANSLTAPPPAGPPPGQDAPQLNPPVPDSQQFQQPTTSPSQQFDYGGYIEHHAQGDEVPYYVDPSDVAGDYGAPPPIVDEPLADPKIDRATAPATKDLSVWSETAPSGLSFNAPGAYAAPKASAIAPVAPAAASAKPHHGVTGFLEQLGRPSPDAPRQGFLGVLDRLHPMLEYAGNVGAGMGMHGTLGQGVGYANQVRSQAALQKQEYADKMHHVALQDALDQKRYDLDAQKDQMTARLSGAVPVPTGEAQPDAMSPPSVSINGVPMGPPSAPMPDSGLAAPQQIGNQFFDYTGAMTKEKELQLQEAEKNKFAVVETNQGLFTRNTRTGALVPAMSPINGQQLASVTKALDDRTQFTALYAAKNQLDPKDPDTIIKANTAWTASLAQPKLGDDKEQAIQKYLHDNNLPDTFENRTTAAQKWAVANQPPQRTPITNVFVPNGQGGFNVVGARGGTTLGPGATGLGGLGTPDKNLLKAQNAEHAQIDKQFQPFLTQAGNLDTALMLIHQKSVGAAIGQIKGLQSVVATPGSGFRMTQTELNSIAEKAGVKAGFENWSNSLSGDGMSDEQKAQWEKMVPLLQAKIQEKQEKLYELRRNVDAAGDVKAVNQIHDDWMKSSIQGGGGVAHPKSKAEYDALPKGTNYVDTNGLPGVKN